MPAIDLIADPAGLSDQTSFLSSFSRKMGMKPKNDPSTASSTSRRHFVGEVTAGLAAVLATPAFAQQNAAAAGSHRVPSPSSNRDPVTQYPRPPFPPQRQDPPGLAGKMDPQPDHGETSYKGSGRLAGRKALLT